MSQYQLNTEKYKELMRRVAADGCVLLKNDRQALPLQKGDRLAVFGRIAADYYKSGLGSGGMVNSAYTVGILDALRQEKDISLVTEVEEIYAAWRKENPFDPGMGWGQTPWSQKEMPVTEELLAAAGHATVALVVIGRTAGEDQDNKNEAGSYLLTEEEKQLVTVVSAKFERTIVLLNTGNIIDMKWVKEADPAAVLYVWQGGQEGGNGVADVLMGRVSPSGHLTDTIACDIADYPSTENFGDPVENVYAEDIFVGYRYFETLAKDKVLYPFGFGLSYTTFEKKAALTEKAADALSFAVSVTNTGSVKGREVVQLYAAAPQGKLGKPAKVLCGFAKTGDLKPGQTQKLTITVPKKNYASYDDSGVTGYPDAFVLEEGEYHFLLGEDVSRTTEIACLHENLRVLEQCTDSLYPSKAYRRLRADGSREEAPLRKKSQDEHRREELVNLTEIPQTGDKGYHLSDVEDGKATMDAFLAQLSDQALIALMRGEGMCSPKVTPGTAAAYGGLTEELRAFGIPALCCTDGPSGIRMDCGTSAASMPNGTMMGATFDVDLIRELFEQTGLELRQNRIDSLLGPGINIHRNPLNGRNFEYVSEDPLLTGKIAAAQLLGMEASKTTGTIKHFATNNQESHRRETNAVVSARALREIYLRGFEIAVKEGKCRSIMTTYSPLNGVWTAGAYDLNTRILRGEWGFDGMVMTDWWAPVNVEGEPATLINRAPLVRAQNDVYMVTPDASDMAQDNIQKALADGEITRAELQRNAGNVLNFALRSLAFDYERDRISPEELAERKKVQEAEDIIPEDIIYYSVAPDQGVCEIDLSTWKMAKNDQNIVAVKGDVPGFYDLELTVNSPLNELAQLPVSIYMDGILKTMVSFNGTEGKEITKKLDLGVLFGNHHYMKVVFHADGLKLTGMQIRFREALHFPGME